MPVNKPVIKVGTRKAKEIKANAVVMPVFSYDQIVKAKFSPYLTGV